MIELIEVPKEYQSGSSRSPDFVSDQVSVGLNHFSIDVTPVRIKEYMNTLNSTSMVRFNKTIKVMVPARQIIISGDVWEMAIIGDGDGCLVEIICKTGVLDYEPVDRW